MGYAVLVHLAGAYHTVRPKIMALVHGHLQNVITLHLESSTTIDLFDRLLRDALVAFRGQAQGALPVIAVADRISDETIALVRRLKVRCGEAARMADLSGEEVSLELLAASVPDTPVIEKLTRINSHAGAGSASYLVMNEGGADGPNQVARCASLFITAEKSRMWPHKSFAKLRQDAGRGVFLVDLRLEPAPPIGDVAQSFLSSALWTGMFAGETPPDGRRMEAARELLHANCDTPSRRLRESFQDLRKDFLNTLIPRFLDLLGPAQSVAARQAELKRLAGELRSPGPAAPFRTPLWPKSDRKMDDSRIHDSGIPVLAEVLEELCNELAGAAPGPRVPLPDPLRCQEGEIVEAARQEAKAIFARHPFPVFLFLSREVRPRSVDSLFKVHAEALWKLKQLLARKTYDELQRTLGEYDESITYIGSFEFARPVWRLFLPHEFTFDLNDERHHSSLMGWVGFRKLM